MKSELKNKAIRAKKSKSRGPQLSGRSFAAGGKKSLNDNPFDKFANAKKKHEVVNRRVKGEDRNVGRALGKSIEIRKKNLLNEYLSSKKSNTFADKRFGEADADLSLEDKMFMRFQKERIKKARNSSVFNLEQEDSSEMLTHNGKVLGESNYADNDWSSDDEDGALGKDVVNSLHFGGGMQKKVQSADHYGPVGTEASEWTVPSKSRMDALQEIVAKSKLMKLEKKELKLEQEDERKELDTAFEDLVSASMVEFQPLKKDKSEVATVTEDFSSYDVSLREMTFDARAQPSDRTKSAEEIAVETRARLEKLEAERLRRMKSTYDPDAEAAEAALTPAERKALKRKQPRKRLTDDDIDDSFGARVVGGGSDGDIDADVHADDDDDDDDDDEEDESGEDDDDDDEDDDDDDDDDNDDEDGSGRGDIDNDGEEEEEWSEDDEDDVSDSKGYVDKRPAGKPSVSSIRIRREKKIASAIDESVNLNMPHKLACPPDLETFDALVLKYVRSSDDMRALIDRILAWNSVHLPGSEGAANRGLMHNFMDILLKHFVRVGDSFSAAVDSVDLEASGSKVPPVSSHTEADVESQLDHLCHVIFKLSQDVADTCAPLWGRTLKIMQSQLQKRLRDYSLGATNSCWPSLGRLLLLRLLGHVFSVTDYQHAVVGPACLLLCQCLSQCPVTSASDVASGILVTSILMDFTKESGRLVPECLTFLNSVLALFSSNVSTSSSIVASAMGGEAFGPSSAAAQRKAVGMSIQRTFDISKLSWMRDAASVFAETQSASGADSGGAVSAGITAGSASSHRIPWSCFKKDGTARISGFEKSSNAAGVFLAAQRLAGSLIHKWRSSDSLPELGAPLVHVLRSMRPQDTPALPRSLLLVHATQLEDTISSVKARQTARPPLQWRKPIKEAIEGKNPRFQVDYRFQKDIDPDADRVKMKQLSRQLKREQKAAMRELRRDSDFLEQERHREQDEAKSRLREERNKNFAWMEEQQATINQQVRMGKGLLHRGGGSGVVKVAAKRPRTKR